MNGIETAVELWRQVDYTLGSQGLMLANGWPVTKIIETVDRYHDKDTARVAEEVLRVCARNLLDFALMERSSEQAICDLKQFGKNDLLVSAVRGLSAKLQEGLQFRKESKYKVVLVYPVVTDLVRLARLEAQSYWSETFVDLYDFAALLLDKCNDFLSTLEGMVHCVFPRLPADLAKRQKTVKDFVTPWPLIKILKEIAHWCQQITHSFRHHKVVPHRYYIGPQLQYSNGVSIYFPWNLPETPITFDPVNELEPNPKDYYLRTPFEEYKTYRFAKYEYGDWARFLEAFFRATLRNVRVVEYEYTQDKGKFAEKRKRFDEELQSAVIDLQKSSSSTGDPDESDCPSIKNYPRRFYLSPSDCARRTKVRGLDGKANQQLTKDDLVKPPCKVSYLGWNIRGLLADVVGLQPWIPSDTHGDDHCCK
jgi:hypothetical protein